jgi:RNA recognition motif-containing protein
LDPAVWVDKQKTDWYSILTIPHHSMRTLYLGNLSSDTTIEDILSSIRGGIVEQIKLFPERSCAFVTFLDPAVSTAIYSEAQTRRIMINGNDIKVGWGKQSSPSPSLLQAVHNGASRNVFIGNTDELVTEPFLHRELSKFGAIDQIKIIPDKRIAFVHMCSISTAMKVVATLPLDPKWVTYRLNYGKDRCAHNSKIVPSLTIPVIPPVLSSHFPSNINVPNRTVYLGGIPTEVTVKDLCDVSLLYAFMIR